MAGGSAAAPTPEIAEQPLETVVREYHRARDYERDVRLRRREGWRVVSVLQRPAQPSGLRRFAAGAGLTPSDTEFLVTYHRTPQPPHRTRPLEWLLHPQFSPGRSRRWAWLVLGLLLIALLAYGLLDFFADAVPF